MLKGKRGRGERRGFLTHKRFLPPDQTAKRNSKGNWKKSFGEVATSRMGAVTVGKEGVLKVQQNDKGKTVHRPSEESGRGETPRKQRTKSRERGEETERLRSGGENRRGEKKGSRFEGGGGKKNGATSKQTPDRKGPEKEGERKKKRSREGGPMGFFWVFQDRKGEKTMK